MKNSLIDIPVALVFFNRPETLKEVFMQIRKIRPSKLYLIQDGPRSYRSEDERNILECQKIVNEIDWRCDVYKNYSDKNMGAGVRVSSGISWVFEQEEYAIILEDDVVVEEDFFYFAKELLEKYKDDKRISMISALNHFGDWNSGEYSYFFAKSGAIAAWATWKRSWEDFDFKLVQFDDLYFNDLLKQSINHTRAAKYRMKNWKEIYIKGKNNEKIPYWGPQWGYSKYKNGSLTIIPRNNLSKNIGVGENATFSGNTAALLPKQIREWFFMETGEVEFPIRHPDKLICDFNYDRKYYDIIYPNLFIKLVRRIRYFTLKLVFKFFILSKKK